MAFFHDSIVTLDLEADCLIFADCVILKRISGANAPDFQPNQPGLFGCTTFLGGLVGLPFIGAGWTRLLHSIAVALGSALGLLTALVA
jgi:hypothetical protein